MTTVPEYMAFNGNTFDQKNQTHIKALTAFAVAVLTNANKIPRVGSRDTWGKSESATKALCTFCATIGADEVSFSRALRSSLIGATSDSDGNPYAVFDGYMGDLRDSVARYNQMNDSLASAQDNPAFSSFLDALSAGVTQAQHAVYKAYKVLHTRCGKPAKIAGMGDESKGGLCVADAGRIKEAVAALDAIRVDFAKSGITYPPVKVETPNTQDEQGDTPQGEPVHPDAAAI